MRIKFLYIENGKITLTKQELEQLLEESYQDGVAEGRKSNNSGGGSLTYPLNEKQPSDYYTTPYQGYWGIDRAIPVTCGDPNVVKISSTGDSLDWTEAGTISITGSCVNGDCVYSTCSTSTDGAFSSAKTYTDTADAAITAVKEE